MPYPFQRSFNTMPPVAGIRRRTAISILGLGLSLLAIPGCSWTDRVAPTQEIQRALAPSGKLRVGVYPGSPTSLVSITEPDQMKGVTVDVGRAMAQELGVQPDIVIFQRVAEVVEALKNQSIDMTVTNATQARAAWVDFSPPVLGLALGVLVPEGSALDALDAMDKTGIRLGVAQGSSSQAVLGSRLQHATLVATPSLSAAADLLRHGQLDGFATNKGILYELSDRVPQSRVLPGSWGVEHLAIAVPKGRDAARGWLVNFTQEVQQSGLVKNAAERAQLRGTISP